MVLNELAPLKDADFLSEKLQEYFKDFEGNLQMATSECFENALE